MNLEAYFQAIEKSSPADWLSIDQQPYLTAIGQVSGGGQPVPWLEAEKPYNYFSFREDISIAIAKGRTHRENFKEDWCENFPGHPASSAWIDFLYNGSLVHSALYVIVDGGRCALPLPGPMTMEVSERFAQIMRLTNHLDGGGAYDFDDYLKRSGAKVVDKEWPSRRDDW